MSRLFGNTADFWLNLQKRYELQVAEDRLEDVLREVQPLQEA